MLKKIEHARTAEAFFSVAAASFTSLDIETALELFHTDSVMVDATGRVHSGKDAIAMELKRFFSLGLPIHSTRRHLVVSGDIALQISDWRLRGTAKDGIEIDIGGTATDVLCRRNDGIWRYIIDNPLGILSQGVGQL
ncbi:hypothetical protein CI807_22370 [Pseudomonas sp. NS1(2017)]|uniref:YybH family protein n=1 Tax=Pseudomonas sp. NS1(2017) TaxID=2025658 RepID=UPI000BA1DCF2|nr:nuclear transport factor 2 family protein [Pseudomonas sp. NS1(2017)]ASV38835.1 hypothetical protein CI807_22370 [Pseudomonas sp. NS1(2017)]